MTTENLLCLLCGSLIATMFFFLLIMRQKRMDEILVRRIRRNGYLGGWADCKNAMWRAGE